MSPVPTEAPMHDLPIIDAHHHLWDLERNYYPWLTDQPKHGGILGTYAGIKRTYMPDDYRRDAAAFRVVKTVHVEAEMDRNKQVEETAWLHEMHGRRGMPNAVVGHVWFTDPECDAKLAGHCAYPLMRGIRSKPVTTERPGDNIRGEPGTMDDPVWRAGFALLEKHGLSWDLRVPFWHLEEAADVARDFPGTAIVLNHTGYPWDRSPEGLAAWRRGMEALARCPNVHVKISELGLPDRPWTVAGNRVVVRDAISIFGVERCMFGSNFPVASLFARYDTIVDGLFEILGDLPRAELEAFFAGNAQRFYRID
jgi:predicted TIM-barrel fold metal-dependent hydrolase